MFGSNVMQGDQAGGARADIIFDVSTADFEDKVLRASMEGPVIVDFWAPWCGPCKQLMPVLESAVKAAGGLVKVAKVNLDENPELAQALQVQSVPTVFAFLGGRPVDAFQGVQPESQIKIFIDQLVQLAKQNMPEALNIPETLKAAADVLAQGNFQVAQGLYMEILEQDEYNVEGYIGLIRTFIAAGVPEHAQEMLDNAPEKIAKDLKFIEARGALEMGLKPPVDDLVPLIEAVAKKPKDQQAKIALAEAQFASGARAESLETLLESIAQDRDWNEQAARKVLLDFFKILGQMDPLTVAARKKLSSLLFS